MTALARIALLGAVGAALLATFAASAWAPLPAFTGPGGFTVRVTDLRQTGVGFTLDSDPAKTPLPVGSRFVVTATLVNANDDMWGKPAGVRVGRLLAECTVTGERDGVCSGLVRLPDGFFAIEGRTPFTRGMRGPWAVTGGVGIYTKEQADFAFVGSGRALYGEYTDWSGNR